MSTDKNLILADIAHWTLHTQFYSLAMDTHSYVLIYQNDIHSYALAIVGHNDHICCSDPCMNIGLVCFDNHKKL